MSQGDWAAAFMGWDPRDGSSGDDSETRDVHAAWLQGEVDEHDLAAAEGDQEDESQVSSQWYQSQLSSQSYVEASQLSTWSNVSHDVGSTSDSSADDGGLAALANDPETSSTVISQEAHNCHEELD